MCQVKKQKKTYWKMKEQYYKSYLVKIKILGGDNMVNLDTIKFFSNKK